jgi:hypothetical protein
MDIVASSSAESGLHFKSSRCSGSWPNIGRGSGHHRKDGWKWGMLYTTYTASIMMCHIFIYIRYMPMKSVFWKSIFWGAPIMWNPFKSHEFHIIATLMCKFNLYSWVSLKKSYLIPFTALSSCSICFPIWRNHLHLFQNKPNYNLVCQLNRYLKGRFITALVYAPPVITYGSLENALQLIFVLTPPLLGDFQFPCLRFAPGTPKKRKTIRMSRVPFLADVPLGKYGNKSSTQQLQEDATF